VANTTPHLCKGPHTENDPKTLFTEAADVLDHVQSLLTRAYTSLANRDPCRHDTQLAMRDLFDVQRKIRALQFRQ